MAPEGLVRSILTFTRASTTVRLIYTYPNCWLSGWLIQTLIRRKSITWESGFSVYLLLFVRRMSHFHVIRHQWSSRRSTFTMTRGWAGGFYLGMRCRLFGKDPSGRTCTLYILYIFSLFYKIYSKLLVLTIPRFSGANVDRRIWDKIYKLINRPINRTITLCGGSINLYIQVLVHCLENLTIYAVSDEKSVG